MTFSKKERGQCLALVCSLKSRLPSSPYATNGSIGRPSSAVATATEDGTEDQPGDDG